ncbi:uncharacterized protein [Porites lutea]|uniref:uncharacterized protein n=1 Tax=Porites lutea TaxID=51062 RepID=UPI003CC65A7E
MNLNETDSHNIDPNESPSVYFCPAKPIYIWILTETAAFYVSITTKSIASPFTVLLNLSIIVAVWRRRALQKNSNILLASMAVADLLVGAVSMPLTTALDILLLRKNLSLTICKIAGANQIVLYSAVSSSLYHLTFIAWDRYAAIKRWRSYKIVVTKTRLKICAVIAWLFAVTTACCIPILWVAEADQRVIALLSIFSAGKTVLSVAIIGYFYISLYLSVRKLNDNKISNVSAPVNARMDRTIAKATSTVIVALLVSYVPSIIVLFFGDAVPFLRTSSYFRWSQLLIQMNSLFNPIVYCFSMNRTFRNEVFEMINLKVVIELVSRPKLPVKRHTRRRREPAVVLEEENEFQGENQRAGRLARSRSCDSIELADPCRQLPGAVDSPPPATTEGVRVICVEVHQPNLERRKPRLLRFPGTSNEVNPSESKERNDENPSNCTLQQKKEKTISSCGEDDDICSDGNRPKAAASGTTKREESHFDDDNDQNFPTNQPTTLQSLVLPREENRFISVHEDQAILNRQKRQIRYTGASVEENPGETEDRYDCLKDFPDTDVTRAGSWPRQVALGLTPVLGGRNIKLEEMSGRPNTR